METNQNNSIQSQRTQDNRVTVQEAVGQSVQPLENIRADSGVTWTVEEKRRLVQIDVEERQRGHGFMNRVKELWDREFPSKRYISKQNLRDNAARFKLERNVTEQNREIEPEEFAVQMQARSGNKIIWSNEMKVQLVILDKEARRQGPGFMKRLKQRWDQEVPEWSMLTAQCLRDNAKRFEKDQAIANLMLVGETIETENERIDEGNERNDEVQIQMAIESVQVEMGENNSSMQESNEENTNNIEMDKRFRQELERLTKSTRDELPHREPLRKIRVPPKTVMEADKVLKRYLSARKLEIPEITDATYAMARSLEKLVMGKEAVPGKKACKNGRIKKLEHRVKEQRQLITMTSNELYRRRTWRKATRKEKNILEMLKLKSGCELRTENELNSLKEKWIDRKRMYEVKLRKTEEKDKRKRNNNLFKNNEGKLYKSLDTSDSYEGEIPAIETFKEFWGNIWRDESKTPNKPWMEKVKTQLGESVVVIEDLYFCEAELKVVIKKKKNWTAAGIDGIPNYWWKSLKSTWEPMSCAMQNWLEHPEIMPKWIASGRTVLIPKTKNLTSAREYRPITCLNTLYRLFTGVLARYLKNHADKNNIWDQNQLGAHEGVLGTVDQLLVDNCIMDEVRTHHRDLAVAYYDYQKAYDMVRHDWILRVFEWMKVPLKVILVIKGVMKRWKTQLEVGTTREKVKSSWINIQKGFLQGDSFSPVGFCLAEVPVAMLIRETEGYKMGRPGMRDVKRTHSLFIDDLKVYQRNKAELEVINDTIVQASLDTGACYGVKKCAGAIFKRGKLVQSDGITIGEESINMLDPQKDDVYKFLGCEQGEGIEMENVRRRLKEVVSHRMNQLVNLELYDNNLVKAINSRVIPVAGYLMNVCKFSKSDLDGLDKIVKQVLRENNMHGKQCSDERLYLPKSLGGRGVKSFKQVYRETKVRVASYMVCSEDKWIRVAWERECKRDGVSIKSEAEKALREVGMNVKFEKKELKLKE